MTWEPPHGRTGKRHRTVVIELDGLLHQVPAEYHATGALLEHMVTARVFHADSLFEECPVPVAIPLYRPTAGTHPAMIILDDLAESWAMEFDVWHNQFRYRITGFYPAGQLLLRPHSISGDLTVSNRDAESVRRSPPNRPHLATELSRMERDSKDRHGHPW